MATKPLPDQSTLLKMLRYEPETGKLFWRERTPGMFTPSERTTEHQCNVWNTLNAGREAFTANTGGYGHGAIFGQKFRAHRVVWKMQFGFDPLFIDHINGDRRDNRIENLRSVTRSENNANLALRKTNTYGAAGIVKPLKGASWIARITKGGAIYHLGSFPTKERAIQARKDAEARLGFHKNHGRGATT